ncbi:hypothetical protein SESBI_18209 [Sesbania bispinosa]|nr:hypothetical protein SESBI_18209 [Sesbania bispinosa]
MATVGGDEALLAQLGNHLWTPVDYESIEKVDFWIVEEETPPELDIDDIELENVIYQDNAVPITGAGDEETELTEPILDSNVVQFGSDDTGGSGSGPYDNILSFDAVNLDECYDL